MLSLIRLCIILCLALALGSPQLASSQEAQPSGFAPATQPRFVVFEGFLRFT